MRTKYSPTEKDLPRLVRARVEGAMAPHDTSRASGGSIKVGFKETILWEERPTWSNPHWTKITFHGNTRFEQGFAEYEGPYGKWWVRLQGLTGPITYERLETEPCNRTYGTPKCEEPSDEWRETPEQRKERIRQWIEDEIL